MYLLQPNLERAGQLDDVTSCELVERFNDVGAWTMSINADTTLAPLLAEAGYGIEVVRPSDGQSLMSGPVVTRKRRRTLKENTLTVSGPDTNIWLRRRRAHPQPGTASPPYNSQAYDVRTGVCSTILREYVAWNGGASGLSVRGVPPSLSLAADPLAGSTVTGRARWQPLLELLQELALAGGSVGFRLRKSGTGLEFSTYQPVDKTATVVFSEERGNLAGYEYESSAPKATYVYVGGGGEGTARVVREGSESEEFAVWGRFEEWQDRRDTSDSTELDQEIVKTLVEQASTVGLSLTPLDTPGQRYRTHYELGDRVTVLIDGEPVQELVTEVKTVFTDAGGLLVQPTVGTASRHTVLRAFDRLKSLHSRVTKLERR